MFFFELQTAVTSAMIELERLESCFKDQNVGNLGNCREFRLGNYAFILNGFWAMTSQRGVGDFVHCSGRHVLKSFWVFF